MINYFEAGSLPKRKSYKDMMYGRVVCKDLKESKKLFKLLDAIANWEYVEGISMNGRKVTVSFFQKKEIKKNVNRKKKMPVLQPLI